jgi:hypothetical protein
VPYYIKKTTSNYSKFSRKIQSYFFELFLYTTNAKFPPKVGNYYYTLCVLRGLCVRLLRPFKEMKSPVDMPKMKKNRCPQYMNSGYRSRPFSYYTLNN